MVHHLGGEEVELDVGMWNSRVTPYESTCTMQKSLYKYVISMSEYEVSPLRWRLNLNHCTFFLSFLAKEFPYIFHSFFKNLP